MTSNHRMDHRPFICGLCRDCRREMWTGTPNPPNGVKVSADPWICQTCDNWRTYHPGRDPRYATNTHAEQVRAEWPEDDPTWRRRGNCNGTAEPEVFDPEPDPDERPPEWTRELQEKTWGYAIDAYCVGCPVINVCRAKAEFHGYEGVHGGAVFEREQWWSPITGASGRTIHHRSRKTAARGLIPEAA